MAWPATASAVRWRRLFDRRSQFASFAAVAWLSLAVSLCAQTSADLARDFQQPPNSARPWINWFWMDGNITREGITADLEAMQRVGLGGVLIMDVTQSIPPGPVRFGTPEWFGMFTHATQEATRLGMELAMHNAPGWCGSGGPWVTPELAMQRVTWVQTNLTGPLAYDGPLPALPKVRDFRRDIAVLAFPTLAGDGARPPNFQPAITASGRPPFNGRAIVDQDRNTTASLPGPTPRQPQFIQLSFAVPYVADRFELVGAGKPQTFAGALQVSDDGKSYRALREFTFRGRSLSLGVETSSARHFRWLFTRSEPLGTPIELAECELTPMFRLNAFAAKSGLGPPPKPTTNAPIVPPGSIIPLAQTFDVTTNLDAAGRFRWDVPAGQWTLLRIGHVPTGRENVPPQPEGRGLECDKLSRAAVEAHFAGFIGKLAGESGRARPRGFSFTHIDSWEIGYQNWTPLFREEFRQRRGYDPVRYLPAFSGRVVESVEVSERFLWDVRRTITELVSENYAAHMNRLAQRHGLRLSIEAYSSLGGGPFDSLDYGGQVDVPMGEFWNEGDDPIGLHFCRMMASAAHTHGKRIVAAEAFSAWPNESKWLEHPAALKRIGDAAFCEGVNRFVLQSHALQPWLNRQPGMTFGLWGLHYDRNQTWWEQSRPWHEYLARCQFMLQRGLLVADVAYLAEEGGFAELPTRNRLALPMPAGRDYDLLSPKVLLDQAKVKDGRLTLADGMSYRVLVLATNETMTPQLLRKLRDLVNAGATVLGAPPRTSPSLAGFPACDADVRRLAMELWSDCDGRTVMEHRLGQGRLIWGRSIEEVLREVKLPPDFQHVGRIAGQPLRYVHRTEGNAEIYFVANPNSNSVSADCSFRVTGKRPELWWPETGRTEHAAVWTEQGSVTRLPLTLETLGSVFVVFRESSSNADPIRFITRNGTLLPLAQPTLDGEGRPQLIVREAGRYELRTASGKTIRAEVAALPKSIALTGPWDLRFPRGWGAPEQVTLERLISWSAHRDPGVRYFSGTASYGKDFALPANSLVPGRRWWLDLGAVEVIAEVALNGHPLGVLWKPPYRVDATDALKAGQNALEIKVVNRWPNRLIGDEQLPDDCRWRPESTGQALFEWPAWLREGKPSPTGRFTFTTWKHWFKDSALLASGLLGPVELMPIERVSPQ